MARSRLLSINFPSSEIPHWEKYTEEEARAAERTVSTVIQPARSHFGIPMALTSGLYWSTGRARDGDHAHPGTLDFDVLENDQGITNLDVAEWIHENHAGSFGKLVWERDHNHVTAPGVDTAREGGSWGRFLLEPEEGAYTLGGATDPILLAALVLLIGTALALTTMILNQ